MPMNPQWHEYTAEHAVRVRSTRLLLRLRGGAGQEQNGDAGREQNGGQLHLGSVFSEKMISEMPPLVTRRCTTAQLRKGSAADQALPSAFQIGRPRTCH